MQKWHQMFYKNTGLSPYLWAVLYILPFYVVFRFSTTREIVFGTVMIIVFFACYVLSYLSRGWLTYVWAGLLMAVSLGMAIVFGYVYFSLFVAFFIGNLQRWKGFITLYTIHLVLTLVAVNAGLVTRNEMMVSQLPFVLVCLIAVILLPVTTYTKNKREALQGQLEDANKRIAELVKLEERQRISRDLHDTLGQKLSLIGIKSDLARRLIETDPERVKEEIEDIRQTARIALKEVREMVTEMRGTRIEDELFRIGKMLEAAGIQYSLSGDPQETGISLIAENVVAMCLKEAVTNVVRHSGATECRIGLASSPAELVVSIRDNGVGMEEAAGRFRGNGLKGMRERLEFVNGSLEVISQDGTTLVIRVPKDAKRRVNEEMKP